MKSTDLHRRRGRTLHFAASSVAAFWLPVRIAMSNKRALHLTLQKAAFLLSWPCAGICGPRFVPLPPRLLHKLPKSPHQSQASMCLDAEETSSSSTRTHSNPCTCMARRMMNEILQRGQGAASAVHILQHHGSPFRKLCTTHRVASKHQRGAQDHRVTGPFCSTSRHDHPAAPCRAERCWFQLVSGHPARRHVRQQLFMVQSFAVCSRTQ